MKEALFVFFLSCEWLIFLTKLWPVGIPNSSVDPVTIPGFLINTQKYDLTSLKKKMFFLKKSLKSLCFIPHPPPFFLACFHKCWTKYPTENTQKQAVKKWRGLSRRLWGLALKNKRTPIHPNNKPSKTPGLSGLWEWRQKHWLSALRCRPRWVTGAAVLGCT